MDFYNSALSRLRSASILLREEQYQDSVYMSCLSIELFLKSKIDSVGKAYEYDRSHDFINMYRDLNTKYRSKQNLSLIMTACRKYFNESRYPYSGIEIYTKEFAEQFLAHVKDVKDYIESEIKTMCGTII